MNQPQQTFHQPFHQPYQNPLGALGVPPQSAKDEGMKISMSTVLVIVYLVGAFGTFGWVWNRTKGIDKCYLDDKGQQHDCFTDYRDRTFDSIVSGIGWPIFWGGTLAIKATAS